MGFVGFLDMKRIAIRLCVDGDRAHTKFAAGAGNSDGNLAAVCN
jgi:hypothetical protein